MSVIQGAEWSIEPQGSVNTRYLHGFERGSEEYWFRQEIACRAMPLASSSAQIYRQHCGTLPVIALVNKASTVNFDRCQCNNALRKKANLRTL